MGFSGLRTVRSGALTPSLSPTGRGEHLLRSGALIPSPSPTGRGEHLLRHMLTLEVLFALHLLQARQAALELKLQALALIDLI